jgi:hypothetical protein
MNNYPWWVSSTGQGVAQRLISLVALVIPLLSSFGINVAPGDVQLIINSAFIVGFGIWHVWAWLRDSYNAKFKLGKYAPPLPNIS